MPEPGVTARGTGPGTRSGDQDPESLTGIVTALPEEAEPILDRLEPPRSAPASSDPNGPLRRIRDGRLAGVPVSVAVTGDGRRNATCGARAFLDSRSPSRLVVAGVAGGLVSGLDRCAVLAGRVVWRTGAAPLIPSDSLLLEATRRIGLPPAVVATVDRLLDSPAAKQAVREELARDGLDPVRAVADLESGFYASAAAAREIPWLVLRAVSDDSTEALPSFLNRCRDEGGAVRRSRVARHVLLHPTELPELLRLRETVRRCARRLADAVEELLRSLRRSAAG